MTTEKNLITNDFDNNDIVMLKSYATQLFNYGDYEGAKKIFYLLVRFDQWNGDCLFLLGQCYQHSGEHEEALFCFSRSGQINIEDPRSAYLAGKSYLALNNTLYATRSFQAAIRVCNCHENNIWEHIKTAAQKELNSLNGEKS